MTAATVIAILVFMASLVHLVVLSGWADAIRASASSAPGDVAGHEAPFISVLVAARNEEARLAGLLQDLHGQRYAKDRYEVLVVDDGSTDGTAAVVDGMRRTWPALHLLRLDGPAGKKAAIERGVAGARGPVVLLTDADARCGPDRLGALAAHWMNASPDMVLLPVITTGGTGALALVQRCEQAALQGATLGSALLGTPVLANGANLAFSRDAFMAVGGYAGDRRTSGDDVFLLQRMRRKGRRITCLGRRAAAVTVEPVRGFGAFVAQRLRWAGKMRSYRNTHGLLAAIAAVMFPWLLVAATWCTAVHVRAGDGWAFTWALVLLSWIFWLRSVVHLGVSVTATMAPEHAPGTPAHRFKDALAWPLALAAFSGYAPLIALASLVVRPRWKGRRVR
jgi:cellulose synthase/poly-beta-1,6-N-acetylglucosamine synthase-like glycosyltransferase